MREIYILHSLVQHVDGINTFELDSGWSLWNMCDPGSQNPWTASCMWFSWLSKASAQIVIPVEMSIP